MAVVETQVRHSGSVFVVGSFVVACSTKVARLPLPGESLLAEAFTLEPGGKGFNLALGARRLGADVAGLLAVGDDAFTPFAARAVADAGLPAFMLRPKETTTGAGIGFVDAAGETCVAVHPGANLLLSAADVRAAGSLLSASGMVLAQFEVPDEPVAEAFALARAAGRPTLLNPSPFRPVAPGILRDTAVLVMNQVEAAAMACALGLDGGSGIAQGETASAGTLAQVLHGLGVGTVVVTLGADGALAFPKDALPLRQPAFRVRAVCTLGAGDAFAAGLAVGLAQGWPLAAALRQAAACGAIAATRLGAFAGLPTGAELADFLATVA